MVLILPLYVVFGIWLIKWDQSSRLSYRMIGASVESSRWGIREVVCSIRFLTSIYARVWETVVLELGSRYWTLNSFDFRYYEKVQQPVSLVIYVELEKGSNSKLNEFQCGCFLLCTLADELVCCRYTAHHSCDTFYMILARCACWRDHVKHKGLLGLDLSQN